MPTSRAQDCAQRIKECEIEVERADRAYRKGGSLETLNKANAALADSHNRFYEIAGGVVRDDR